VRRHGRIAISRRSQDLPASITLDSILRQIRDLVAVQDERAVSTVSGMNLNHPNGFCCLLLNRACVALCRCSPLLFFRVHWLEGCEQNSCPLRVLCGKERTTQKSRVRIGAKKKNRPLHKRLQGGSAILEKGSPGCDQDKSHCCQHDERAIVNFLVLLGSLLSITESTEYTYFSLLD